jgi:hypothetical protein
MTPHGGHSILTANHAATTPLTKHHAPARRTRSGIIDTMTSEESPPPLGCWGRRRSRRGDGRVWIGDQERVFSPAQTRAAVRLGVPVQSAVLFASLPFPTIAWH